MPGQRVAGRLDRRPLRNFATPREAAAAAARLGGDVRLAGSVVVEFTPGGLSDADRAAFAGSFSCSYASC